MIISNRLRPVTHATCCHVALAVANIIYDHTAPVSERDSTSNIIQVRALMLCILSAKRFSVYDAPVRRRSLSHLWQKTSKAHLLPQNPNSRKRHPHRPYAHPPPRVLRQGHLFFRICEIPGQTKHNHRSTNRDTIRILCFRGVCEDHDEYPGQPSQSDDSYGCDNTRYQPWWTGDVPP